ncbi:MAG TPA: hypothetical protein VLW50_34010 [Streptosporangiaceae bacterium]|nr:hypothetical protein [Streptosporangiaceae bacterium]
MPLPTPLIGCYLDARGWASGTAMRLEAACRRAFFHLLSNVDAAGPRNWSRRGRSVSSPTPLGAAAHPRIRAALLSPRC